MKTKYFFLVALVITCCLTACKREEKVNIAGILPLSGDYYLDGLDKKKGIDLAIAQRPNILGKKINFICKDSKSERSEAINLYNKLAANKNICGIIDGGNSILSEDVASVSQKKALPLIIATASLESITSYGDNIFRTASLEKTQGECMAKFALDDLNLINKTCAILYNKDSDYSISIAKAFANSFKQQNGKVLLMQAYLNNDTDFSFQLNKIKILNPEVLFLPDNAYNVSLILEQMRNKNLNLTVLGSDAYENVATQSTDNVFLSKIYYCTDYCYTSPRRTSIEFVKAYEEKYKEKPGAFAALSYDATNILLDALERAKSIKSDDIINALNKTEYDGASGKIEFDKNGNPIKNLKIVAINQGEKEFIKAFVLQD